MLESYSIILLIASPLLVLLFSMVFIAKQYRRCPSNKVLVIYGKGVGEKSSRCIHGGGVFIIPLIQDFAYMSLEPMSIQVSLKGALSAKNIRVDIPSVFTVGIDTNPDILTNAAERLLGLKEEEIKNQALDIIQGQLRQVIAGMTIEEINTDRDKFMTECRKNVGMELNKIGLKVINMNIRDITDESGYIAAIGKKAAAEAVQQASIDVAEQEKQGSVGVAEAKKEQEIQVARTLKDSQVGVAIYQKDTVIGKKEAEKEQRIKTAEFDADAISGENEAKAIIAQTNAELAKREAEALREGQVAKAIAAKAISESQKEAEVARLRKEQLAQKEVEKQIIEVDAEAEAEKIRREARGQADAVLAKYKAEAEGIKSILESKAEGYKRLIESAGNSETAATLLMIEKLEEIARINTDAIKNIKFDKVTVWDSGNGNGVSGFLKSFATMLPPLQDLAKQTGFKMPEYLGELDEK